MYCKKCGKELSEGAAFCDKCGTPQAEEATALPNKQKKPKKKKKGLIAVIAVIAFLFVIALIAIGSGDGSVDGSSETSENTTEGEYITYEEYEKIQNGMTYDEVVKIIGCEGRVASSSTVGDITTVSYNWSSKDMGGVTYGATVAFIDGVVTGKSQVGLDMVDDVSRTIDNIYN